MGCFSALSGHFKPVLKELLLAYTDPNTTLSCAGSALGIPSSTVNQPSPHDFRLSPSHSQHLASPVASNYLLGTDVSNLIKSLETLCPHPPPFLLESLPVSRGHKMRVVAGLPPHICFDTMETRFHGAHVCLLTARETWLPQGGNAHSSA